MLLQYKLKRKIRGDDNPPPPYATFMIFSWFLGFSHRQYLYICSPTNNFLIDLIFHALLKTSYKNPPRFSLFQLKISLKTSSLLYYKKMMGSDDNQTLFPPPQSLPLSPLLSFDSFQSPFEFKTGDGSEPAEGRADSGEILSGVPKPLEWLHETPIPPFLSKTYDLVDDPCLDSIISWGEKGVSFVVWDSAEFARMILPRNFKHNNFSSFVRQLNTYGFRKIDTDKWEFANEGFVRGRKHLLKKIQRRKSPHPHQLKNSSSGSSNEVTLEGEIENLRKERSLMMREVLELQHQQQGTIQHMEVVKEKLDTAEKRQKQTVSFLAKMLQKPAFLARTGEQKSFPSPRPTRKFVKHHALEMGKSSSSPKGQIVKYQPEPCNFTMPSVTPNRPSQDMEEGPLFDIEPDDEFDMVHELLHTPDEAISDPLVKGKGDIASPQSQTTNDRLISFPEDLVMERSIPEDLWSMGFEAGAGSSITEPCGNLNSYNMPELCGGSGLSDNWDIGAANSGIEGWLDEDYSHFN